MGWIVTKIIATVGWDEDGTEVKERPTTYNLLSGDSLSNPSAGCCCCCWWWWWLGLLVKLPATATTATTGGGG